MFGQWVSATVPLVRLVFDRHTPIFCIASAHSHALPSLPLLQVAGHFTTCSITVLEQRDGPQFIFGLDMLKRHLCVLDMAAGQVYFHHCSLLLRLSGFFAVQFY
jgi:hypothetical protein